MPSSASDTVLGLLMVTKPKPHEVLGVAPTAGVREIKTAYRRLALRYHPDRSTDPQAGERMQTINMAYDAIMAGMSRAAQNAATYSASSPPRQRSRPAPEPFVHVEQLTLRAGRAFAVAAVAFGLCTAVLVVANLGVQGLLQGREAVSRSRPVPTVPSVARTPGGIATGTTADQLRANTMLHALSKRFPGVVMVPQDALEPFAGVPLVRVDAAWLDSCCPPPRRYSLEFGAADANVRLSGTGGREAFDAMQPRPGTCPAESVYCVLPLSATGWTTEHFSGLRVRDSHAMAVHRQRDQSSQWSLAWYDASRDVSYQIDLSGGLALRYATGMSPDNIHAARRLVETASQLAALD